MRIAKKPNQHNKKQQEKSITTFQGTQARTSASVGEFAGNKRGISPSNKKQYSGELAETLVELLGIRLADEFIKAFAGQTIYIQIKPKPDSPLVQALGIEGAKTLSKYFASDTLEVPKSIFKLSNKAQIIKLATHNIKTTGRPNLNAIAKEVGVTTRWVKYVLAETRKSQTQPNLFGDKND